MNLKSWVELERGRAFALARAIDVPASFVSKMVTGEKGVPIERCVPIERATGGAVTRKDLRPDDYLDIWPELAEDYKVEARPETAILAFKVPELNLETSAQKRRDCEARREVQRRQGELTERL